MQHEDTDSPPSRPISPDAQRHAAVVLEATRALAEVHEGTVRGLREVEVMFGASTPRAVGRAIRREHAALHASQHLVTALQEVVDRDARLRQRPRLEERPTIESRRGARPTPTAHLSATRQWNLRERHRLSQTTLSPARRLTRLLREQGHDATARAVETLWTPDKRP